METIRVACIPPRTSPSSRSCAASSNPVSQYSCPLPCYPSTQVDVFLLPPAAQGQAHAAQLPDLAVFWHIAAGQVGALESWPLCSGDTPAARCPDAVVFCMC
jgi:hypothetical protein